MSNQLSSPQYVKTNVAMKRLGCTHSQQLLRLERCGRIKTIRTPGGQRLYDVDGYLKAFPDASPPVSVDGVEELSERPPIPEFRGVRFYSDVKCQKNPLHKGVVLYRPSDGALLFMCETSGCHSIYTVSVPNKVA